MTNNPTPPNRRKGADSDLASRMAALGATAPTHKTTAPRRNTAVTVPTDTADTSSSMAAEQPAPLTYSARLAGRRPARIELPTTPEQREVLEAARGRDRISNTARLRALIDLYDRDEKIRRRVDKLAITWRD